MAQIGSSGNLRRKHKEKHNLVIRNKIQSRYGTGNPNLNHEVKFSQKGLTTSGQSLKVVNTHIHTLI